MERAGRIELRLRVWKTHVLTVEHYTRINNFMHIYDAVTNTGLHIHLSMNDEESFYILVYDIDNFMLTMRFFNKVETALEFIQSL